MGNINYIYEVVLYEHYNSNVDAGGCQFPTYHSTEEKAVAYYNKLKLKKPENISSATKRINRIKCYEKLDCSKIDLHFAVPEDRKCILSADMEIKLKEFNPFRCVANKNELRPAYKGVYHADGLKVATDCQVLTVVKSEYPTELEGKIVGKDGAIINERYPQYKGAIPNHYKCKKYSIDTRKLSEAIVEAKISASNSLTYIAVINGFNIRICHAKLILSFLKIYRSKEVYIDIAKSEKGLSTIQIRSGDNIMLCASIGGNKSDQVIINNNLTTKI